MWMTPLQTVVAAALLLAYVLVTHLNSTGPRITGLLRRQQAVTQRLANGQRDFEKDHHLVVAPPMGTPVVLIAESRYLREYHDAAPGQLGTVIEPSRLGGDDNGVLVDWGVRPNDMVRMDLSELKLAPQA
jgi:hypothetical protein